MTVVPAVPLVSSVSLVPVAVSLRCFGDSGTNVNIGIQVNFYEEDNDH